MKRFLPILILFLTIFLMQCEDETADQVQQSSSSMTLDTLFEGKSVYISGFYSDSIQITPIACYWKDGGRIDLDYGWAEDIKVLNGDISISGRWTDETGWNGSYCYWKNGARTDLQGGTDDLEVGAIFVDDGDVYVAGTRIVDEGPFGTPIACYWKNGARTDLTTSEMDAMAYGIGVNNGDVYVTGWRIQNHTTLACYWKNGEINNLHGTAYFGEGRDIAFKGNNVYISGHVDKTSTDSWNACYWRNGNRIDMARNTSTGGHVIGSEAFGIFIDGSDIYLAGYNLIVNLNSVAVKWRNGNTHELSGNSANEEWHHLWDIAVEEGIKISVGYFSPDISNEYNYDLGLPQFPIYYVNGKRYQLEDSEYQFGDATGVFIE